LGPWKKVQVFRSCLKVKEAF